MEWAVVKGVSGFAGEDMTEPWQIFASTMAASVVYNMFKYSVVLEDWPHNKETQDAKGNYSWIGMKLAIKIRPSCLIVLVGTPKCDLTMPVGKCPAAPLPGNFNRMSSQEIFLHLEGNFWHLMYWLCTTAQRPWVRGCLYQGHCEGNLVPRACPFAG
jgi:hypothetical protein